MPLIDLDCPGAAPARASSRGRASAAALSSASLLVLALLLAIAPASAEGGRGGNPDTGSDTGGASGIDNPTGAGGAGGDGTAAFAGGGGGGAGAVTGGAGGVRGGTGGVHGTVDSVLPVGNSTGSAGGGGLYGGGGSGGGGGAGGYGAVVTGAGTAGIVSGTIIGGNGGAGGDSVFDYGGSGGSGGIGIFFNDVRGTTTLTVNDTVQGGNGGARGTGGQGVGSHGAGGAGIVGANLSITNNGAISGGLAGDGATRATAIRFAGGANSLTFGNASSGLTGGIVVEAGTLTFAQPTDATVANAISGAGAVVKSGAGTLTLTGVNTYTGGTTINAGTLVASSSTALSANSDYTVASGATLEVSDVPGLFAVVGSLSGAGAVQIGSDATLAVGATNRTASFSGGITGNGSLSFTGSGTQIYTGTGTLGGGFSICACDTGQFIIRGGTLTFGDNIDISGGTHSVEQGGTLVNSGSGLAVLAALRIDGAGSSVTTDVFLLQGLASNASLVVSGGAALTVNLGAAVQAAFGGSANALVTGAGSLWSIPNTFAIGPGSPDPASVTLAEGGELRITTGDLQIDTRGTLNLGNGGAAGLLTIAAGAIVNDGAIVANFTDAATLSHDISGTGTLTQRGTGVLTLTGTSTYTGGTTVSGGRLVVNGSIAGFVTLSGGSLGGSGTIGGVSVGSGATVAPGNSIGTLNVAGNVAFGSGSTYQVEINAAGQSDRIVATGTATITGGTVQVLAEAGTYAASTSYVILTAAGGVAGQFSDVTSNLVFLTPSLSYGGSNVILTMTRNATGFVDIALTRNQGFIANAAERLGAGNAVYDTLVSGTAAEARAGFDLLSGEAHAQAVSVMIDESRLVRETILGHLRGPLLTAPGQQVAGAFSADLPGQKGAVAMAAPLPQPRYALWGQAFGGAGNSDADGNAAGLSRRSGGALLGADMLVYEAPGSSLKLGLAGGYSQSRFDLDARRSSGKLESGHAGLYAGARFGQFRLDAGLAYSWSESDIRRQVAIRGFGDSLRLQRPGAVAQGFAELGYGFAFSGFALEPFAQLALIRVSTDAGTERGGAAALRVLSSEQTLGFTTLGLRAEAQLGAMPLFARALLGWRHGFGELTPQAGTAFASGTTPAQVFAATIDRDALLAEAGLDWRLSQATALGLTYSATIGDRARDHALKGRVEMRF